MANGRLRTTSIPPYGSAEIYSNTSGAPGSLTVRGQVNSVENNSFVSMAVTATDYSSTINVSTAVTTTSVNTCCCLLNVVYCCASTTEDYVGYQVQVGASITSTGYNPSFVTENNQVYSKLGLTYNGTFDSNVYHGTCNMGVRSTAVNPELMVCCFGHLPYVVQEVVCDCFYAWTKTDLANPCTRAIHFASSGCCFISGITTSPASGGVNVTSSCCVNFAAVDMYGRCQISFSESSPRNSIYYCTTAGGYCSPICLQSCIEGTTYAFTCYTAFYNCTPCNGIGEGGAYRWGPLAMAGCRLFAVQTPVCLYVKAFSESTALTTVQACLICSLRQYNLLCWCDCSCGVCFPVRWMGYNPSVNCNYFMLYTGMSDASNCSIDGIYSINHAAVRCPTEPCTPCCTVCECLCPQNTVSNFIGAVSGLENGYCKVSNLPSVFAGIAATYFCPSRLYHAEYCKWYLGVNDGSTWRNYVSCDLINWDCTSDCYIQLTGSTIHTFNSNGTGINKSCNCYSCVLLNSAGALEYCVCANQYTQTGLVVSDGDKIYVNNYGNCPMSVNVWGYEG